MNEQREILNRVKSWDRALAEIDAMIEAKEERLKGLRQRLLTGDVRFPEFDKPWRQVRLGELFREREDKSRDNAELLSVTMQEGVVRTSALDRKDTSNSDKSRYLFTKKGDIVYNSMRMWQGVFGISPQPGIVSPAYTVCVPSEEINTSFASHLFTLPKMINRFRRYSQGMVKDTLKLHFESFCLIEARIPPTVEEQHRIASFLDAVQHEIDQLRALRSARARQKKGLMQRLLTGEVRV